MQILKKTNLEAWGKANEIGQDGVIKVLIDKGLVGRGGAAFPTGKKWQFTKNAKSDKKYVICNADEGEPGTFKDKLIIKENVQTMLEGILIAAYTVGAKRCFIYLRGEYEYHKKHVEEEIQKILKEANTNITIEIVMGAGAYVCGEETAIIQSIMGFRGQSQHKPPYPPVEGLWGKPTVVNNVETLTCAAQALVFEDWDPNLRLFSVSGNVQEPGVYEFPLGIKMSKLIEVAKPKHKLKAMSFGCFGGIMPFNPKLKITNETICEGDCFHGAYTVILIDEKQNVVDIALSIARFYTYESCGKCTPCREGTIRMLNILKEIKRGRGKKEDLKTLDEFAKHVQETSLCGLGQTAGQHIITSLEHFREDYEVFLKK